ncbi:MAG: DUF3575 domain-containing protein [Pyrinomonadaceae bacterium]|nr:DUF3575 domain-containing protein [Sphingobacteriaceae bacterium]
MKTISNNSKKLFGVFSLIGILLTATVTIAQPTDSVGKGKASNKELKFPKNNFKINLSSLAFKSYSLYYERSLSRKISFSAGYRTMPSTNLGGLPLVKKLNEKFNDGDELLEGINRMEASGNAYTGEFRFYGGKKPGARGFYLALYGRYATFNHDYDYRFTSSSNSSVSIPINSKVQGFGGGLMLGKQWLIAKRVNLDVYILGAHYGKLTGTSNGLANLSSLSDNDKQNLKDDLEGVLIIKDKPLLSTTVNNQGITGKIDGPFAGVRGLGFSLGIAF